MLDERGTMEYTHSSLAAELHERLDTKTLKPETNPFACREVVRDLSCTRFRHC